MESEAGDITVLLRRWKDGDPRACDQLMDQVYPHLRAVAASYLRLEPADHTLQPTALVHELYLKLLQQREADWENRARFYAFAATVMRRILVDHARGIKTCKRGVDHEHLPLSDYIPWIDVDSDDALDLDRALDDLESVDPRKVRLIELRYFLGCTVPECADLAGISRATAERDLTTARTWLYSRLIVKRRATPGQHG